MIVHRVVFRCKVATSQVVSYLKELYPEARMLRPQTGQDFPHTKIVLETEAEDLAALESKTRARWGKIKPDARFWEKWRSMLEAEEDQILRVV